MNQMIQVQDGFEVIEGKNGIQLSCYVGAELVAIHVFNITGEPKSFYLTHQFDIEEAITDLIENQAWNGVSPLELDAKSLLLS